MPRYDSSRHDPPAPVALVSLRRAGGEPIIPNVPMLIDSGADITLLPRDFALRHGIVPLLGMQYQLVGFDGSQSAAQLVKLDLLLLGKAFRGDYLLIDGEWGILGRDVLNRLRLLFDGPAQEWSEV